MTTKVELLNRAIHIVGGRGNSYGRAENNFARIAAYWNAFMVNTGRESAANLTPGDVARLMALMKLARLDFEPKHGDSWVDLAGYAACGAEIEVQEQEPTP